MQLPARISSVITASPRLLIKWAIAYVAMICISAGAARAQKVVSISIDGSINPASADFIRRGITKAKETGAECLLIRLNTPGGLLKSTRVIVSDILESPVPVVVYVSPGGAHAGSAGVFITMAAHIAAMAPGTNIGAAHPVSGQGQMDTIMNEKVTNDATAFIRTIAERRKRNVEWAVDAVKNSVSITESEALANNVINFIAAGDAQLLDSIHGMTVTLATGDRQLETSDAGIETLEMRWMEKMLNILSDPNVAYILFLLGLYGLMFELYSPGAFFPGILGGISLILALYAMHTLPVNYAGVALIVFAVILFLLEIKITSHGVLAIGGIIAMLLGSFMLIRTEEEWDITGISLSIIIPAVAVTALFFLVIVGMGVRAQRFRSVTGIEGMTGKIGETITALNPGGNVMVHGEIWKAESHKGEQIAAGKKVRVVSIDNFTVRVEPV